MELINFISFIKESRPYQLAQENLSPLFTRASTWIQSTYASRSMPPIVNRALQNLTYYAEKCGGKKVILPVAFVGTGVIAYAYLCYTRTKSSEPSEETAGNPNPNPAGSESTQEPTLPQGPLRLQLRLPPEERATHQPDPASVSPAFHFQATETSPRTPPTRSPASVTLLNSEELMKSLSQTNEIQQLPSVFHFQATENRRQGKRTSSHPTNIEMDIKAFFSQQIAESLAQSVSPTKENSPKKKKALGTYQNTHILKVLTLAFEQLIKHVKADHTALNAITCNEADKARYTNAYTTAIRALPIW